MFHDGQISVTSNVPADLPDVTVDPIRIGHVLANLLTNAAKFTPHGGGVTVTAEADGDEFVRFAVADTGIGIAAGHLPRVFDRFFRVPATTPATPGAGLGLAIAREIVHAHGGSMDAQSEVGRGSRFSFTLRRASATKEVIS